MKLGHYVVRCIKGNNNKYGFGYRHKKGQYVTYRGKGSPDLSQAWIYSDTGHYNEFDSCPLDDLEDWDSYYEYVPVHLNTIKAITEVSIADEKSIEDKVFSWGYKDIAPIKRIHKAMVECPHLKLYRYRDNLLLVLAEDAKDAARIVRAHPDWAECSWLARDFKLYKES